MGVSIRGSPIARWLMENPIEKGGEVSRGSSAGFRAPHPVHGAKKNIRLVVAGNDEPETPLEELTEVLEDSHSGFGAMETFQVREHILYINIYIYPRYTAGR